MDHSKPIESLGSDVDSEAPVQAAQEVDFQTIVKEFQDVVTSESKTWMKEAVKDSKTFYLNIDSSGAQILENLLQQNAESFISKALSTNPRCILKPNISATSTEQYIQHSRTQGIISDFINFFANDSYKRMKANQIQDFCITGRGVLYLQKTTVDYSGTTMDAITTECIPFNRFFVVPTNDISNITTVFVSRIIPVTAFNKQYPDNKITLDSTSGARNLNRYVHLVERWCLDDNTVTTFTSKLNLNDIDDAPPSFEKRTIDSNEQLISVAPIPSWCGALKLTPNGLPFSIIQYDTYRNTVVPKSPYSVYRSLHELFNSHLRVSVDLIAELKGNSAILVQTKEDEQTAQNMKNAKIGDYITVKYNIGATSSDDVAKLLRPVSKENVIQELAALSIAIEEKRQTISAYAGMSFAQNSQLMGSDNATNAQLNVLTKIADEKYRRFFSIYERSVKEEYKGMFHILAGFSDETINALAQVLGIPLDLMPQRSEISDLNFDVTTDEQEMIDDATQSQVKATGIQTFLSIMNDPSVQSGKISNIVVQKLCIMAGSGKAWERDIVDVVNQMFNSDEYKQQQQAQVQQSQQQAQDDNEAKIAQFENLKADTHVKNTTAEVKQKEISIKALEAGVDGKLRAPKEDALTAKHLAETARIEAETQDIKEMKPVKMPSTEIINGVAPIEFSKPKKLK